MDKQYLSLDDILADGDFGDVFNFKSSNPIITADDRLIESFNEINKFIEEYGHEPSNLLDMNERKLAKRLEGIRNEPDKVLALKEHDKHNLLQVEEKQPKSLDDILQDDFLADILGRDNEAQEIFDLKHVKHSSERQESDFIARRKACKNFAKYELLFKQCQADLQSGKRSLISFDEKNLVANTFFVLNGQLGYLEDITAPVKRSGNRHDGRTYCIFENGTESNMQFLSLAARLYEARKEKSQAFTVSLTQEEANTRFVYGFNQISDDDKSTGYIYILKSESNNPKIANIDDLYKIGYSTIPVEERIKNAENEATYLMSGVEIISVYECYNLNPQKFEHIIHTFFAEACINLDVFGKDGNRYNPREWFILPLHIVEYSLKLILSGEIINYQYDSINLEIKRKQK